VTTPTPPPNPLAVPGPQGDPQVFLARAIEVGAAPDTLERLMGLYERWLAMRAREAWYAAMAKFQQQCPPIKKTITAKIQTARAQFSYTYAPLDEILATVQPILTPLELSISWRSTRVERDHVVLSCRVTHALGHSEDSGDISMPIVLADPGTGGATPPQRVGIALTYARRYSLMAILGIAPEEDDDANGATTSRKEEPANNVTAPAAPEFRHEQYPPPPKPPEPGAERSRFEFWRTTLANTNSPKGFETAWKRVTEVWAQFSVDEQTVLIDTKEAQKRQLGIN
jgi:hypothetical protein